MKSKSRIWLFLALVAATLAAHVAMMGVGGDITLGGGNAERLLVAIEHPKIAWSVGSQILVVLVAYGLLFWLIHILSAPRREARHKLESPSWLLVGVWFAVVWLGLRLHSNLFPYSSWTWFVSIFQRPVASWALDGVSVIFLFWRFIEVGLHVARRSNAKKFLAGLSAAALVLILSIGVLLLKPAQVDLEADPDPNVILIGLDSVRRDLLLTADARDYPNIAALREQSYVNSNVVTPLARTFPAWVSILTGLGPSESGARANHSPQAGIKRDASVAWDFKRAGYRTIYATDETRFSNIVSEFGFDKIIGPQMGVPDFVMGQFFDMPLVNFLVQLPYSEYVLPALSGNRAFAHAYRPERFVGQLINDIGASKGDSTFLSIHLCTAHWPYYTARDRKSDLSLPEPDRSYRAMMLELDMQLGLLLKGLRSSGYVHDKTLVVVLADHGEGLAADKQSASVSMRIDGVPSTFQGFEGGHGATLLAPDQWKVFTLYSGWSVDGRIEPGVSNALASLEDVAPTLRRLAGLSTPDQENTDRQHVTSPPAQMGPREYVRFESGWRPKNLDLLNPTGSAALKLASNAYNVLPDGRLEFKPEIYKDVVRNKEFAVSDGKNTLAVISVNLQNVLVARGPEDANWTGQFVNEPGPPASESPVLEAACEWTDMRAHMGEWCSSLPAMTP